MAIPHYEQCLGILKSLELHVFFPKEKITRKMALTVPAEVIARKDLDHPRKLPWFMLQNIIAGNYEGMSFSINRHRPTHVEKSKGPVRSLSNFFKGIKSNDDEFKINSLDVLTSLFICCDDFLRQILVEKLSNCQLGIPLLLPVIDATPQTSGVEMLSWATSTIRKQWKTTSGSALERSMAVHPLPIVSALRIGRPKLSKSKILNETISSKRDPFFHCKCVGGNVQKVISNGTVELIWYLPIGSDGDTFPNAFGVMNLRGNVLNHSLQRTFMKNASSTSIIFCQSDISNKEHMNLISSWNDQNRYLILVFDGEPNIEWKHVLKDVCSKNQEAEKLIRILVNDSIDDLALPLKEILKQCMSDDFPGQTTPKSIEDCEAIAINTNIRIDDRDKGVNYECKLKAMDLLECLKAGDDKDKHLPLQAISRDIALKKRELFNMKGRGDMGTELYIEKVTSEIVTLQEKQFVSWKDQSKMVMVKQFLTSVTFTSLGRSYFYNWTSTMLNRHSTCSLQPIREAYKHAYMKKAESAILEEFAKQILNASLGLENLNREIAQIYEMASELSRMESDIQKFPEIAADMLIDGQPLEIMDGDATYVPTTWLKAVFNFLKAKIGNKKLFVLSIVGVQGSGKSTMLNTMFGLKFAVDAGRCTKGAFAQLVPLDENLRNRYKSDYIMVVDTEGLCAPEFAAIDRNTRDKELATFIIGLADCTIINFMGDNQAGIQEILQIVVYALMKMKLTNLKPSCIFVHQYKSDLLASEKNVSQKIRLSDLLDKATKIAADVQGKSVKSFSEVINFQPQKHVAYISNLWLGIPPMATTNPEYVRDVLDLRKLVFTFMKERHSNSIDEFSLKVADLSKAVLYQEFSFCFINALEIQAYNSLETEYIEASRDFRQTCMSNRHACINACKAIPAERIEEEGKELLDVYNRKLRQSYKTFFSRMKEYIRMNPKVEQWELQMKNKASMLDSQMRKALLDDFKIVKQTIIWKSKIDKGKGKYLQEIQKKSRELADELKGAGKSELELETQFNISWEEWIKDIPEMTELLNIEDKLEDVLLDTFVEENHVIHCLLRNLKDKQIVTVAADDIKRSFFTVQKTVLKQAAHVTLTCQEGTTSTIHYYRDMGSNCNEPIIKEIVDVVYKLLKNPPNSDGVLFTLEGVAKHTCCILWKLIPEFKALQKAFKEQNDPRALMLSQRQTLWKVFQNECTKVGKALTTAFKISLPLNDATDKAINLWFVDSVVGYFRTSSDHKHTFVSKKTFHAKMLIDLAEKNSFDLAAGYLINPAFRMSAWLQEYIVNALDREENSGKTLLQNIYYTCVRSKYREVIEAITIACKKNDGSSCKVNKLCQDIISCCNLTKMTPVMTSQLHIVWDNDEIEIKDFLPELFAELNKAEANLRMRCNTELQKVLRHEIGEVATFFEKDLIGCEEACPFCKAPCDNIAGCTTHRTECHRPQGFGGLKWEANGKLITDLCTTTVANTNLQFREINVEKKWHKFHENRKANEHYKSWMIPPIVDTTTQLYWKWFMAKYNKDLAEFYGCKEAEIPDSWKKITWKAAKQDLINLYNIRT